MPAGIRALATAGFVALLIGLPALVPSDVAASTTSPVIFVAPTGNDATCARGNRSRRCASFNRAYSIARCGDVIEVEAGSYGNQEIVETATGSACTRRPIVFRPPDRAQATVNYLSFGVWSGAPREDAPDNIVLSRFKVTWGISIWGDAENVTLDRIDGGSFYVDGARNVTIRNSDWGPCTPSGTFNGRPADCRNYYPFDPGSGQPRIGFGTTDLLVENNTFHDMVIDVPGAHWECLWIGGGTNVTFRGNRFENCETNAIAFGDDGSDAHLAGTWLIEKNWCGRVPSINGCLKFGGLPYVGKMVFRLNSFMVGSSIEDEEDGDAQRRVIVVDNILGKTGCVRGAVYARNLFPGRPCGASDRTSVFGYVYDGTRLVPDGRAALAVQAAFAEVAAGKLTSLRLVARKLARERRLKPTGGWNPQTVRAIVTDKVYLGRRLGIPTRHPPLVSRSEWRKAQRAVAAARG